MVCRISPDVMAWLPAMAPLLPIFHWAHRTLIFAFRAPTGPSRPRPVPEPKASLEPCLGVLSPCGSPRVKVSSGSHHPYPFSEPPHLCCFPFPALSVSFLRESHDIISSLRAGSCPQLPSSLQKIRHVLSPWGPHPRRKEGLMNGVTPSITSSQLPYPSLYRCAGWL